MTTPPEFPEPFAPPLEPVAALPADPKREDPPWTGFHVLMVGLFTVAAIVVASFLGVLVIYSIEGRAEASSVMKYPVVLVAAQALAYVMTLLFTLALLAPRSPQGVWRALRFNLPHDMAVVRYVAAGVGLAVAMQLLGRLLPIPPQLPIEQYFRTTNSAYAMSVLGIVIAPFFEELFFRGLLYPVLARRIGMAFSVAICALSFAALHASQLAFSWVPLLLLTVVGVAFTMARAHTGSLSASWIMHTAYNTTLMGMFFVATNGFRNLERVAP